MNKRSLGAQSAHANLLSLGVIVTAVQLITDLCLFAARVSGYACQS